jgi:hypothetical protein
MHVVDLLSSNMFDIEVAGQPATIADVFPAWHPHDRFGVLIYEPLGGIGATHLIQIAITSFYDVKPVRRTERKIYPEIYAIHVGKWWGTHADFDFWPSRRECLVSGDHRDLLDTINDRGITRLALPERPVRDIEHRRKEEDAAFDRIATTVMYSASGRVSVPDFSIRGNDRRTESNPQRVLKPIKITEAMTAQAGTSAIPVKEADPEFSAWLRGHVADITPEERSAAVENRTRLREGGLVKETYRFVPTAEALKAL